MIVYSHATSGPIAADEEEVRHQLFHAHRYRNKLTELDHAWYRAKEEAQLEFCPGLEEAQEEYQAAAEALKEIEDQIKAERVRTRKRGPASPPAREEGGCSPTPAPLTRPRPRR